MGDSDIKPTRPLYLAGGLFLVALLTVAAWNIELPYLAFSPGPTSDAADVVRADDLPVFDPDGELLILTLVTPDVNVFEALIAGFDPTIDLVRRQSYRADDETDQEYRERVLAQMDDSRSVSIQVALEYLGIPVDIYVAELIEGLPAGDHVEVGDRIRTINGTEVGGVADVIEAISISSPGEEIELEVVRAGIQERLVFALGENPEQPGKPMMGVRLGHEFPVSLDTGNVGGPSAGLMHSLAIIEVLTPGDLGRGHVIAGTGTISLDGSVGAIGGGRQKVVAAEAAGASYMLVPASNWEDALTAPRDDLELVRVATLIDAIEFLESLPES